MTITPLLLCADAIGVEWPSQLQLHFAACAAAAARRRCTPSSKVQQRAVTVCAACHHVNDNAPAGISTGSAFRAARSA